MAFAMLRDMRQQIKTQQVKPLRKHWFHAMERIIAPASWRPIAFSSEV
jgi:hypothetical protein